MPRKAKKDILEVFVTHPWVTMPGLRSNALIAMPITPVKIRSQKREGIAMEHEEECQEMMDLLENEYYDSLHRTPVNNKKDKNINKQKKWRKLSWVHCGPPIIDRYGVFYYPSSDE